MARKVVSIDRESEQPADLWLQRYGVRHKVWLRQGLFAELAPTCGGPFSACLIDGESTKPFVIGECAFGALPLLSLRITQQRLGWSAVHSVNLHAAAVELCQLLGMEVPWVKRW